MEFNFLIIIFLFLVFFLIMFGMGFGFIIKDFNCIWLEFKVVVIGLIV